MLWWWGPVRSLLIGLLGGTIAWALWALVGVLWQDHQRVTQLWELEIRRAQAVQQAGVPATAP